MSQIYKATYSGVPVYEMTCNNVAVMRRRVDSYLNATQILKVAEFDKPQRTRVLEKEVQTGQHEKVQGGYGKYQGTWVPFERGVALAEHYHVDNLLRPIFDFVKGDQSPPLAPKHVTAASTRPRKIRITEPKRKKVIVKRMPDVYGGQQMGYDYSNQHSSHQHYAQHYQQQQQYNMDVNAFSLVSDQQQQQQYNKKKRPRPMFEGLDQNEAINYDDEEEDGEEEEEEEGEEQDQQERADSSITAMQMSTTTTGQSGNDRIYAQKLLQYFISDDNNNGIPAILLRPPSDLDVNVIIDDEGHTSLHWAAAMGRLKLVQILIELGADIYRVNYKGQTALMRSVLFTNNFDSKSFLFLIEMLKKTIFNIDKKDQTVFHHVSATASWKGKVHASRYYMECLIETLSLNQSELISILNVQDVYGDTALSIAARIGNKKLVRLLMEAGASAEIANEEGMTAQDYLSEVERNNRFQPPSSLPSQHQQEGGETADNIPQRTAHDHKIEMAARTKLRQTVEGLFRKIIANDRSQPPVVSQIFDGFAGNYERELIQKDHLIKEKKNELELTKKRLIGTKHTAEQIQFDPTRLHLVESEATKLTQLLQKQSLLLQKESIQSLADEEVVKEEEEHTVEATEEKAKELYLKLQELQANRKQHTRDLMQMLLKTPSKRHQEYKRLISMCCNVSYENVDLMLLPLLSSFDELLPQPPQSTTTNFVSPHLDHPSTSSSSS